MDPYSDMDEPQLQWLEDLINKMLSGLNACFSLCWHTMKSLLVRQTE